MMGWGVVEWCEESEMGSSVVLDVLGVLGVLSVLMVPLLSRLWRF